MFSFCDLYFLNGKGGEGDGGGEGCYDEWGGLLKCLVEEMGVDVLM